MSKKKAMVSPAPHGPTSADLAIALQIMGNDRAYTVVHIEDKVWTVWFEGDDHPTVITFESDKPELK